MTTPSTSTSTTSNSNTSTTNNTNNINANTAQYCYIDFDINDHRNKFSTATKFVYMNNIKYGFTSKNILELGGSELSRINDLIQNDYEWTSISNNNDIEIRPPKYGNRIIFQLYWDVAPIACENFATLCYYGSSTSMAFQYYYSNSNNNNNNNNTKIKVKPIPIGECGKPITYKNSTIHRIVPQFIVQGGDYIFQNGTGGESIYNGKKFKDEKNGLLLKHNQRGILSMGNSGKNSNTSQFFITFASSLSQCDGKHVIFGRMVSGYDVLDAIEQVGTSNGTPSCTVTITDCGIYIPFFTPSSGFWYDPPPDIDSSSSTTPNETVSSIFIVRPRVIVIGPNHIVLNKFKNVLESKCCTIQLFMLNDETTITDNSTTIATTTIASSANTISIMNEKMIIQSVQELLQSYSIDVILIAPACHTLYERIDIPTTWNEQQHHHHHSNISLMKQNVIFECKPYDALITIYTQSWIQQLYQSTFTSTNSGYSNWKLDSI